MTRDVDAVLGRYTPEHIWKDLQFFENRGRWKNNKEPSWFTELQILGFYPSFAQMLAYRSVAQRSQNKLRLYRARRS